jgi:predicted acylesterase/phospholipase RssA
MVLSGGAYKGLQMLGALKYLHHKNFFNIDNIKTIHCVSVGSIISLFLCLKIKFDDIIHYTIHRPWEKLFDISLDNIITLYKKKGLLDKKIIESIFNIFFKNNNLNNDLSLKELYNFSNIELYIYSVNLKNFKLVEFSYKTHPNLPVIDAIYMSSCLPLIFEPLFYEDSYYIDGGVLSYYPIDNVLCKDICNNEILGVRINDDNTKNYIEKNENIISYGFDIINKLIKQNINYEKKIKYEVILPCEKSNTNDLKNILILQSEREKKIKEGERYAELFFKYN